jgi:TRAP-type C4-dicarboxylate transport system substrate-binding protein
MQSGLYQGYYISTSTTVIMIKLLESGQFQQLIILDKSNTFRRNTNLKTPLFIAIVVLMLVGLVLGACTAEEDKYFVLEYGQSHAREVLPEGFDRTFAEYVMYLWEQETGGHIKVEDVSETIGRGMALQMPALIGSGQIDIGFANRDWKVFPLSNMPLLPGWGIDDSQQQSAELWQWCWQHPLVKEELAEKNIVPGWAAPAMPMYLMIRKGLDPITTVADLEGLKARSFGHTAVWAEELGMTPVNVPMIMAYKAIEGGKIDVSEFNLADLRVIQPYEVCDQVIDTPVRVGGGGGLMGDFNLDTWNKLPQYTKDALFRILPEAWDYAAKINEAGLKIGREKAIANGMKFIQLSPEDKEIYLDARAPSWEKWVEDTEAKEAGARVREYIADCIAFRDQLTGKPFTLFKP